ncbi:CD225/dispanin family protein [Rhodococcus sp. NPDC003348]
MSTPTEPTATPPPESAPPSPGSGPAYPPRPPSNAGWAVAALIFFWPLAFSAFTHAVDVYPLWAGGDPAGARDASERVRRLGQISLWLFGGLLLLFLIVYVIVAAVVISHGGAYDVTWHHNRMMR